MTTENSPGFSWTTTYVGRLLPDGWHDDLLAVAEKESIFRILTASSVTSREESDTVEIPSLTVDGRTLKQHAPWLDALYRGAFRDLAETFAGQPVECSSDDLYGAVLNVQRGRMRYECHVDSNPVQGLLYVTTHEPGTGGELVVARDPAAHSPLDVDADCDLICPVRAQLLFFDARRWPHYVRALHNEDAVRVVVAMNFYTSESPESDRPDDLNEHLFSDIRLGM